MIIRKETPSDTQKIFDLTKEAFKNHPYSQGTEPLIIDALRKAGALTLSLVATIDEKIVGHIAFSPITLSDGSTNWYGLGPISVAPKHQRQGIGKALIIEGLSQLKTLGAHGCALVGDPKYYNRFGFKHGPNLTMKEIPPQNLLALPFTEKKSNGEITFHPAFFVQG